MTPRTGTALWLVFAVAIATALVQAPAVFAQARAERSAARGVLRVLFIGNSYTFYDNLGDLVAGIAASDPLAPVVEPTMAVRGGATLRWHLSNGPAVGLLQQGRWDAVVLQEQSLLGGRLADGKVALGDVAAFHASVREFTRMIRAVNATPVLFMTWARREDQVAARVAMQQQLAEAYQSVGRELGVAVAPVGLAWGEASRRLMTLDLHQWDGSHPTPAGSYLAASVLYHTLVGRSPVGAPSSIRGRPVSTADADILEAVLDTGRVVPLVDLPSATAGELQRIASDTVDARRREDHGPLVGTWSLEAARAVSADGRIDPAPYGKAPTGLLTYTADAYMQVILSFSGRERLSGDFRSAPAAERAEAFATSLSYAGRYTVAGDRVVHHVEVATDPNRVGTRIERTVDLAGDRLTLTTPPTSIGGVPLEVTLTWRRVR
jgi:hypothetical protein